MDHRTQHILDAIDGALADDEFPDAMRWSPEPETVDDAPAPFDGELVWQPPQRYEDTEDDVSGFVVGWGGHVHRTLTRPRQNGRGVWVAPAGTEPPVILDETHSWRNVGRLVDDLGFSVGPFAVQPWQGAVLADVFGVAIREAVEAIARAFAVPAQDVQRMADALADLRPMAPEEPEPEEPRARALRLRRERNTGPSRDLTRQRRPRRLP